MPIDSAGVVRQYNFSAGPNYADSIFDLDDKELAECENMFWDGKLKTLPGGGRLTTHAIAGSSTTITGVMSYEKADGSKFLLAASQGGRIATVNDNETYTYLATVLSTSATTRWDSIVFNDTFIACSGTNVIIKWDGVTSSVGVLGGSPPNARYITAQGDYVFIAGHTSAPTQIRYSDTADATTWPIGNVLNVGLDDGQVITGLERFGDTVVVFKEGSVWLVSGQTPDDFAINPTPSEIGCVAPQSIAKTEAGIFFWSEAGPAIFNGFKSTILGRRIRPLLDLHDFQNPRGIHAVYYPYRKQVLCFYPTLTGLIYGFIIDMSAYGTKGPGGDVPIWPITYGAISSTTFKNFSGRRFVELGMASGYVEVWDCGVFSTGILWDNLPVVPRVRTRAYSLGKPDRTLGGRAIDVRTLSTSANLILRYALDGATNMTTHGTGNSVSLSTTGKDVTHLRFFGDGEGSYAAGKVIQVELTTNSVTGLTLLGLELTAEEFSKRIPTTQL